MTYWDILGIQPTDDMTVIKKAYRHLLAETNPEDKPEEFMVLRRAYEDAMESAGNGGTEPETDGSSESGGEMQDSSWLALYGNLLPENHPAWRWTKDLQALYLDFSRRIRPENWTALLEDPICTRIDTAADAEDALLRMLMEWWFLPDSAICAMNAVFDFDGNRERLFAHYPKDFVEAILLNPLQRGKGGFDYNLFEGAPDAEYDTYINLYYTLTGQVNRDEQKAAWETVSQMESLGIEHPYLAVEKAKLYLAKGEKNLAAATMEAVYPAFDCSPAVCCMAGEVLLEQEDFVGAKMRFEKALEVHDDSHWARIGLAEAGLGLKDYDEAEKWVSEVLAFDRYSPRGTELEGQIQACQKKALLEKLADGEASAEEKIKLAVIFIDGGDYQPAAEILSGFTAEDRKEEAERHHFLASAQLDMDQFEEAAGNFLLAENSLRQLLEVAADTEEKANLGANLCRTMVMRSLALENLGKTEEALTVITNAAVDYPNQNMVFCRKAELHYEMKQYEKAVDAAAQSIRLDDSFHLPYRIRANAYYELGHYNDAYQDCNDCISIYGGDIEAFFCKINILIEVGEIQDALQELDDLEAQVQGTKITFLRGKAHEAAGNPEQARESYLKVLDMNGDMQRETFSPADLDDLTGTYFRLYHTLQKLYRETENSQYRHDSMKYLQEGAKLYPDDLPLISELAGELYGRSRHEEAQELYRKMVKLDPSGRHFAQLAGNEIQMDRFADAEAHLLRAAELEPELTYTAILFGALYTHTGRYQEALSALSRAQALAAEKEEAWYRILRDKAMVYCRMKDYDHAKQCLRDNFRLYQQQEDMSALLEVLRMAGRFHEVIAEGEKYLESHEPGDSPLVLEELKSAAMYLRDTDRFTRYTSLETQAYTAVYQCGRLYMYMTGEENRAVSFLEKAVSLRESDINANIDLAKLYLKLKNKKKAAACAGRVLDAIPKDFMDCGYNRAYYLVRSAEALAILGKYKDAFARLQLALDGRKCDFCKYSGCIDACCALVYIACIQGEEDTMQHWLQKGLAISPYDYDLKNLPDAFLAKKSGLFTRKRGLFQ